MVGPSLKKKNHYLSFNTPFFVDLADFPLAPDDPRHGGGLMGSKGLVCWRCHRDFGNKFESLKRHLAEEFEEWKKE
jgi:aprataxin